MHYVRFTESRATVNEQRIVLHSRVFRNGARRGNCETVTLAHDEIVESITRIDKHCVHFGDGSFFLPAVLFKLFGRKIRAFHAAYVCGKQKSNVRKQRIDGGKNFFYKRS